MQILFCIKLLNGFVPEGLDDNVSSFLGNCLAPNRRQAIACTNCDHVHWYIYSSPCLDLTISIIITNITNNEDINVCFSLKKHFLTQEFFFRRRGVRRGKGNKEMASTNGDIYEIRAIETGNSIMLDNKKKQSIKCVLYCRLGLFQPQIL